MHALDVRGGCSGRHQLLQDDEPQSQTVSVDDVDVVLANQDAASEVLTDAVTPADAVTLADTVTVTASPRPSAVSVLSPDRPSEGSNVAHTPVAVPTQTTVTPVQQAADCQLFYVGSAEAKGAKGNGNATFNEDAVVQVRNASP